MIKLPPLSSRSYTKSRSDLVILACFALVAFCVGRLPSEALYAQVVGSAFMVIAASLGLYQVIGHLDMRKALSTATEAERADGDGDAAATVTTTTTTQVDGK